MNHPHAHQRTIITHQPGNLMNIIINIYYTNLNRKPRKLKWTLKCSNPNPSKSPSLRQWPLNCYWSDGPPGIAEIRRRLTKPIHPDRKAIPCSVSTPPWNMHRNPRICPDKRWPPELPERAAEWTQIHPASSSLAPMATPYSSCCLWVWEEVNTESTSPAAKLHVECIYLSVCHVSLFGQLFPQLWVLWAFAVILQIDGIFVLQVDPSLECVSAH